MRVALWPFLTERENDVDSDRILADPDRFAVFVATTRDGAVHGFLEASLRAYAEGCDTSPVGFIEGWFVDREVRRQGMGAALVAAAEEWARQRGCTEMASDTTIENVDGQRAHTRLGYSESERLVCFRKSLG